MEGEVIELCVDVPGAIAGIPSIVVSPELGLEGRHRGEEVRAEQALVEPLPAVHQPDVVVLVVVEASVPLFAHEQAVAKSVEVQVGEYDFEDVIRELVDAQRVHVAGGGGVTALSTHCRLGSDSRRSSASEGGR